MVNVIAADKNAPTLIGAKEEEPEDHQHQRDRAHEVDVGACKHRHGLDAREPHHREQGAEDDAAGHRQRGEREREAHPLPEEVDPGALDNVEVEALHQWPACGAVAATISPGTRTFFSTARMST